MLITRTSVVLLCLIWTVATVGLHFDACAQVTEERSTEHQRTFERGAAYLFSGKYSEAARVFEALYSQTRSDRVKLEWARSAYLAGNLEVSRKLFREVLENRPPLIVRKKVRRFLDQISIRRGKFDYSIGPVRDTNPRSVTSTRTLNLFGNTLRFRPEEDTGPQYGIGYHVTAAKALDADARIVGRATVFGTEFTQSVFSRTTLRGAIGFELKSSPKLFVRPSFERSYWGREVLYDFPHLVAGGAVEEIYKNDAISYQAIFGKIYYPDFDHLDGFYKSGSIRYHANLASNFSSSLGISLTRYTAVEDPYSYWNIGLSAIGQILWDQFGIVTTFSASYDVRPYDGDDVFFLESRKDDIYSVGLIVGMEDWIVFGFYPVFEVRWVKHDSDIPLYQFSRVFTGVRFSRFF